MELRYCENCGDVVRVDTEEPLNPNVRFVCQKCAGGKAEPAPPPAAKPEAAAREAEATLDPELLNLFSPQTVALRKKQLEALEPKPEEPPALRVLKAPSSAVARTAGSAVLAKAQKLLFRCLHCRATLSIRPVSETSKLTCPHCTKTLYVTPAGKLLSAPPSSVVARASRGARSPLEPSPGENQPRPGSAAKRTGQAPAGSSRRIATAPEKKEAAPAAQPRAPSVGLRSSARPEDSPTKQEVRSPQEARPRSAFEDHLARNDPSKTKFLSEEPTKDLRELAAESPLHDDLVAPRPSDAFPEEGGAALIDPSELLADPGDLVPTQERRAEEPKRLETRRPRIEAAPARRVGAGSKVGAFFGTLLGSMLILAVVFLPFFAAHVYYSRGAFADGRRAESTGSQAQDSLSKIVRAISRGLCALVNAQDQAEAR